MKHLHVFLCAALIIIVAAAVAIASESIEIQNDGIQLDHGANAKKVESLESGKDKGERVDVEPSSWSNVKALWG